MPTFEMKHPDGRTFEVDAPDMKAAEAAIGSVPPGQPISQLGAAGHGLLSGLTAGFADELYGLMSVAGAGELQASQGTPPLGSEEISKVYTENRDEVRGRQKAAREEYPKTYLAGEVAGGLALPVGAGATAATLPGRMARGAAVGSGVGAVTGAGEGEGAADTATRAAIGGVAGAALGGAAAPFVEGVARVAGPAISKLAAPVINKARGAFAPREEAARQVVTAIERDIESDPGAVSRLTPREFAEAHKEGQPVAAMDLGGGLTRRLADVAAITSPEAETTLKGAISNRFETQSPRIAAWLQQSANLPVEAAQTLLEPQPVRFGRAIRSVAGDADATADIARLQEGARRANRPAYTRAYEAGDREIWSPELERLTSAPSIRQSMQAAVNKWKDWQVVDGFGGVNPGALVERGQLSFQPGRTGVPTFPNIQFWDYTARNIADKAEAARRAGRGQLAAQLGGLERQLKSELDRVVPEYQEARQGAAAFFGANDALEAGRLFVGSNANIGAARQAMARMSPAERELFARGYASELADQVERTPAGSNLIASPKFSSEAARQKNQLALGQRRAEELEQHIAPDRVFHTFGGATNAAEAGGNFVGSAQRMGLPAARRALSQMSPQQRQLFQDGYAAQLAEKIEATGDRRSVLNQIAQSEPARQEIRMALGPQRADQLEARLRIEGIMDLVRSSVTGNSWTARRLYDVGLAGGAGLGLQGTVQTDPKEIAVGAFIAALSSGGKKVNANVMRHVADLLVSGDLSQLAKGVKIIAGNSRLLDALRATDRRIASVAGEQSSNLPAIQSGGVSRAEGDQNQVPRPPGQ